MRRHRVRDGVTHLRFARPVHQAETGATNLEMIVVLSLLAVLLVMSFFSLRRAVAREQIDGWARSLTYDLAAGRQQAMTRRTTVTASIGSTIYTIGVLGGGTLRQQTMPSDITLTTTCAGGGICSFNRRGVPISAGTITLTSTSTGRTFTVTIQADTGRVSYSEP